LASGFKWFLTFGTMLGTLGVQLSINRTTTRQYPLRPTTSNARWSVGTAGCRGLLDAEPMDEDAEPGSARKPRLPVFVP
jgi:hypothetical protein